MSEDTEDISMSMKEKVEEILFTIGCEKEVFREITNYEEIDIENLLNNLKELAQFKYTKSEINKIIFENINLLYVENQIIKENIVFLEDFFITLSAVKECIFNCPNVLTMDDEKYKILAIFNKYEIPEDAQKCILIENPMIFLLGSEKLEKQLKQINEQSENYNKFILKLINSPKDIGVDTFVEINDF